MPVEFHRDARFGGPDDGALEVEVGSFEGEFHIEDGARVEDAIGAKQDAGAADVDAGAADPLGCAARAKPHGYTDGEALRSLDEG